MPNAYRFDRAGAWSGSAGEARSLPGRPRGLCRPV